MLYAIYIYYKAISNLPFINSDYIINIYSKIRCESNNNNHFFKIFRIFFFLKKKKKLFKKL